MTRIPESLSRCLAVAAFLTATPARPAEFHAVITNFGNAPRPSAHLDVSVDTAALPGGPVDVFFDVYKADGTLLAEFCRRSGVLQSQGREGRRLVASGPAHLLR
jgi:hypothetical protein